MSTKGYVSIVAVIALLAGLLAFINRTTAPPAPAQPPPPPPAFTQELLQKVWPKLVAVSASPPLGSASAPYTAVEIGDFQCPNCGMAKPLIEETVKSSNGKAKLYFINYPLPNLHPHAVVAAEAGMSAAAQGKFWQMYDLLYAHQDELIPSEIEYYSRSIPGLNSKKVEADMATNRYARDLARQLALVLAARVESVPTLFVRSPDGKFTWYEGTGGTKSVAGIVKFAGAPPWGGGMGMAQAQAYLAAAQKANQDKLQFGGGT